MTADLDLDRDVPRRNGELVFDEPWQSRAFGMALAMNRAGSYGWDAFADRLTTEIATSDGPYYEAWVSALERLVVERGLVSRTELDRRAAEYGAMHRDDVF
jgi:nitrile hydratase accessory protein